MRTTRARKHTHTHTHTHTYTHTLWLAATWRPQACSQRTAPASTRPPSPPTSPAYAASRDRRGPGAFAAWRRRWRRWRRWRRRRTSESGALVGAAVAVCGGVQGRAGALGAELGKKTRSLTGRVGGGMARRFWRQGCGRHRPASEPGDAT